MRELAIRLQCVARQKTARTRLLELRREKAAVRIQTTWRRYAARKAYLDKQRFIVAIQTAVRAHFARRELAKLREIKAAVQIQKLIRGWYVG